MAVCRSPSGLEVVSGRPDRPAGLVEPPRAVACHVPRLLPVRASGRVKDRRSSADEADTTRRP